MNYRPHLTVAGATFVAALSTGLGDDSRSLTLQCYWSPYFLQRKSKLFKCRQ